MADFWHRKITLKIRIWPSIPNQTKYPNLYYAVFIRLLSNKFHGLSPSGGHYSLLFDQGFPNNAQLQCHLVDRDAIWRFYVSMLLYLAMLFILSIENKKPDDYLPKCRVDLSSVPSKKYLKVNLEFELKSPQHLFVQKLF